MMYPRRRAFLVKIWMTEVTDKSGDNEEHVFHCSSPKSCHANKYSPSLLLKESTRYQQIVSLYHEENANYVDLNNNQINEKNSLRVGEHCDDFEEGYEKLDEIHLHVS